MYVSKADFRRRLFEGLMRREFPLWRLTFSWHTEEFKEKFGRVRPIMITNPEWERLGAAHDVHFLTHEKTQNSEAYREIL